MATPITRRALLASAACYAVARGTEERRPSLSFPAEARARLAVTSYPFRALIESPTNRGRKNDQPGMDLTAFAGMIATKFQVFNINPLADHFASTDAAYLQRFRTSLKKAKSHIVDLGLAGREFYSTDPGSRQEAVDYGRKWIEIAAAIGSPSVRQHVHGKKNQKPDTDLAARSLGQLAEYGAKHNVVVGLENDDQVSEDPFFLVSVIEKVGNPYLRALPDFGNSLPGHDAAYNQRAVGAMLDHAFNMCHVKELMEANGKRYQVDLAGLFSLAKQRGYRGYFSMECESEAEDPFAGTQRLVNETLHYLS
jgi:sugar phosphate isomerase/epimerase